MISLMNTIQEIQGNLGGQRVNIFYIPLLCIKNTLYRCGLVSICLLVSIWILFAFMRMWIKSELVSCVELLFIKQIGCYVDVDWFLDIDLFCMWIVLFNSSRGLCRKNSQNIPKNKKKEENF